MRLKIVFTGAQGVGKTTLMNAVNMSLDLPVVESSGRSIMSDMDITSVADMRNRGLEPEFQSRLNERTLDDHTSVNEMISDRSIFDRWGYDRVHFLTRFDYESAIKRAELHYDLIVRVPAEFPLVDDSVRDIDEENRKFVQEEIFSSVEESGLPFMTVSGSVHERAESVLNALDALYGSAVRDLILDNQNQKLASAG